MQVYQLQKCRLLLDECRYYYLTYSATATSWAVTGSGTPNGWPDNGYKITI
jgi:hypothetical protein